MLEVIADIEKTLEGRTLFGMTFVRSRSVTAASHAYRMIQNLKSSQPTLSGASRLRGHPAIGGARPDQGSTGRRPPHLALSAVSLDQLERVGGKSANLGEMKNRAGLPVPEGFAITTGACIEFFEANQLQDEIRALLLGLTGRTGRSPN